MSQENSSRAVQSLWIGNSLSLMEVASIRSFLRYQYEYRLYVFDEPKNVPAGTTLLDARAVLPKEKSFYQLGDVQRGGGSVTAFSNIFRWLLLYEHGGAWVDTDLILLRPLNLDAPCMIATEARKDVEKGRWSRMKKRISGILRRSDRSQANNCFIKIAPKSELMRRCVEYCASREPAQWADAPFGTTGVKLIQRLVREMQLESCLLPVHYICPIDHWDAESFHRRRPRPRRAYAVHLWNEMWRRNNWDKNRFEPGSLYDLLTEHVPDRIEFARASAASHC